MDYQEKLDFEILLIGNIRKKEAELRALLDKVSSERMLEDRVYRFYHNSYKVYDLQDYTQEIYNLLLEIGETNSRHINSKFYNILSQGTHKKFESSDNARWEYEVRPILEAFWHAKHVLSMMVKYGLDHPEKREGNPGWFTVLYLYNAR